MNNPELYNKCNSLTREAAIQCLEEYADKMNWKENDRVMDVGCGDGSVTQIIKKYIPRDYNELVACDINENMIKYASTNDDDERTTYTLCDIGGDLRFDLRNNFDHLFSFFTLHWIQDQEKAFRNIFNILREGGECLLSILGYIPIYNIFIELGRREKWNSSWLKNLNCFISPYYDMQNIEAKITDMFKSIGFSNIEVENKKITYVLNDGLELKNLIKAVEPYHMPEQVFEDFINDYISVARDIGLLETTVDRMEDYNNKITYTYNLIVIYAKKPVYKF